MSNDPNGACVVTNGTFHASKSPYRYPTGVAPGDVVRNQERLLFQHSDGVMALIIFYIVPLMLGILVLLLLMSTISYLCFSILRLFYLDTLKPYKIKKLKGLGKHHYYYHITDPRQINKRWKKQLPNMNTVEIDEHEFRGRESNSSRRKTPGELMLPPPGTKLSYTSPPLNTKGHGRGGGYQHVIDLLDADNLNQVSKFPSQIPKMYVGGMGAPSRIPIPTNRKRGPWTWNPEWYKKQLVEEKETGKQLEKLHSDRNQLQVIASQKFITPPATAVPENPIKLEGESDDDMEAPKSFNFQARRGTGASLSKKTVEYSLEDPVITTSRTNPSTSLAQKKSTTYFTTIPFATTEKKTYKQQLMILRGGPRKDAKDIMKMLSKDPKY